MDKVISYKFMSCAVIRSTEENPVLEQTVLDCDNNVAVHCLGAGNRLRCRVW